MKKAERPDSREAFVLHSYPYRETSLVIEAFTHEFGRVALIAKGARRPASAFRGLLLPFQGLLLSWFGKSELRTLSKAEWQGGHPALKGMALICGLYLNELLMKLLPREDPHDALFVNYRQTLKALGENADLAGILRCFEVDLLRELGYAPMLESDSSGNPLDPERVYTYELECGPTLSGDPERSVRLAGKTLLDMASNDYSDRITQQQSKMLMRMLIDHHLGAQTLHTRRLLRDLQTL